MTNEEKFKTVEERSEAFQCFCRSAGGCVSCAISNALPGFRCLFEWLALEAEEKPLPCPFCGGDAKSEFMPLLENSYYYVRCKICRSSTRSCKTKDEAIAAWNRREK